MRTQLKRVRDGLEEHGNAELKRAREHDVATRDGSSPPTPIIIPSLDSVIKDHSMLLVKVNGRGLRKRLAQHATLRVRRADFGYGHIGPCSHRFSATLRGQAPVAFTTNLEFSHRKDGGVDVREFSDFPVHVLRFFNVHDMLKPRRAKGTQAQEDLVQEAIAFWNDAGKTVCPLDCSVYVVKVLQEAPPLDESNEFQHVWKEMVRLYESMAAVYLRQYGDPSDDDEWLQSWESAVNDTKKMRGYG